MIPVDAVFASLQPVVPPLTLREILEAAAGWKTSRIVLDEGETLRAVPLLRASGLAVGVSEGRYRSVPASTAAGWSHEPVPADEADAEGELYVYLDVDEARMVAAADAEAEGDAARFGELLGIPRCCRAAFLRSLPFRGDPLAVTAPVAQTTTRWGRWTNAAASYTGYGLLSFAPCTQGCPRAAALARRSWRLLSRLDPTLATRFITAHDATYVWSESHGVHELVGPWQDAGVLRWEGLRSTRPSALAAALEGAGGLRIRGRTLEIHYEEAWSPLPVAWGRIALFTGSSP